MLEILANIETLTLTEKTSVQANLTTLSSHSTSSSSTLVSNQPRYTSHLKADLWCCWCQESAAELTSDSEMFGELSSLISICFRNQSEEEASAVHAVTGDLQNYTSSLPGYQYDMGITPYPHNLYQTTGLLWGISRVRCSLLFFWPSTIEILLLLVLLPWCLCGWEASCWALHVLSLFCLCLILPPLTIKDSVLNGAKYDAQASLIP